MDIHKPKAAHSWREFLIEIGTIICGILIALGLEQGVEQFHAREQTEELDKALRVEVTRNLGEALQQASMFYCLRSQAARAADKLVHSSDWPGAMPVHLGDARPTAAEVIYSSTPASDAMNVPDGVPPPSKGFSPSPGLPSVLPAPRSTLIDRTWLTAASTPGLLHMDRKRRDRYALLYYQIEELEATIADQDLVRRDLTTLAYPQHLSAEERHRYLDRLSRFDNDNRKIYSLTGLMVSTAERNGIKPDPTDVKERFEFLKPGFGDCVRPFVMPLKSRDWAEKFEADRNRFGGMVD